MTTLSKATLSALAASGTAAGGGLIYNNREKIFGKNEISRDQGVNNTLESSKKGEKGPDSSRSPEGEVPTTKAAGEASDHSNQSVQQSDDTILTSSPVNGGNKNNAPSPRIPTSSDAKTGSTIDYQCSFKDKEYKNEPNKKDLKQFLKDNGGEEQGLQILGDKKGEFKCAKDVDDDSLSGLKNYLNGERNVFSAPKNKVEQKPNVWAVKKDEHGWTIYGESEDDDSDEEEILMAIKPEDN